MKITYCIIKKLSLSDEEVSSKTGNGLETVCKIREGLMGFVQYISFVIYWDKNIS